MESTQRKVYVISDLHLGGVYPEKGADGQIAPNDRGFRLCTQVPRITQMVRALSERSAAERPVELIINGDILDILAERSVDPPYWHAFVQDPPTAAARVDTIVGRDPDLFQALGELLERGHALRLLLGNHDVELALPAARRRLEEHMGVRGAHDFAFVHDGEAYVVGDALIEHGNRYDPFNVVDNDALRRVRSLMSRHQAVPRKYDFPAPAGSHMVAEVINPIKEQYRFIDLLKPTGEAVIPMLLALEPGFRKILGRVAKLSMQAGKHRLAEPAMPGYGGDIRSEETVGSFGGDMGGPPAPPKPPAVAPALDEDACLEKVLAETLPSQSPREFLDSLPRPGSSEDIGSDISARDTIDRTVGMIRLFLSGKSESLESRLPALLQAVRAVQDDESRDRSVETAKCYLEAARDLAAEGGFRYVLFGHTHHAKDVELDGGARYLNSGTWIDQMNFPAEILSGTREQAIDGLRAFVEDVANNRLADWTTFEPTYIRLDLDAQDRVRSAELCDYTGPQGLADRG